MKAEPNLSHVRAVSAEGAKRVCEWKICFLTHIPPPDVALFIHKPPVRVLNVESRSFKYLQKKTKEVYKVWMNMIVTQQMMIVAMLLCGSNHWLLGAGYQPPITWCIQSLRFGNVTFTNVPILILNVLFISIIELRDEKVPWFDSSWFITASCSSDPSLKRRAACSWLLETA